MNSDYFSVDAILAENQVSMILVKRPTTQFPAQKIQCTFKEDLPELGHLGGGGSERHVRASSTNTLS